MQRVLGFVTLLAAGAVVLLLLLGFGAQLRSAALSGYDSGQALEPSSFALGSITTMAALWILQLPWASVIETATNSVKKAGRNAVLLTLAAGFASLLLLY